jgi:hypothetical protein
MKPRHAIKAVPYQSNFLMKEFFMTQAPRSTRRQLSQLGLALLAAASMSLAIPAAQAQSKKDSVVVGMILEPTSLDPTTAPAAAKMAMANCTVACTMSTLAILGSTCSQVMAHLLLPAALAASV